MDPIEEWTQSQSRVIELVEHISADDAEKMVPACPDWTVRELLSHVIGLDADVIKGDEPDDHNPTWTQRQVDERADHDIAALVAEWRGLTGALQDWMRTNGARPMGDVIIHEQDLRGALGVSGAQDSDGLKALRDRMAVGFTAAVEKAGLPGIELVSLQWQITAGNGTADVTVNASEFDLTRALMSRRSADQLRSWTTDGDIEPYLPMFAALGSLPGTALTE
jgi:uncharacterized protein (TIGR03083 family)